MNLGLRASRARAPRSRLAREDGFTMADIAIALALGAVLLTLGATAVRGQWHRRSLEGAADALVTELRALQERVVSETHPLVYGARFVEGEKTWSVVKFDPVGAGAEDDKCVQLQTHVLDSGVFASPSSVVTADFDPSAEATFCRVNLTDEAGNPITATTDDFLFFYARGSATRGVVVLRHSGVTSDRSIFVKGVTGRVTKL